MSAEQAADKQKQLGLMHLIYRCATITIVALAGNNSDAGLAGVSHELLRIPQSREAIHGYDLFTVPDPDNLGEDQVGEPFQLLELELEQETEDRGPKWIPGGSDGTQGQPSRISRKRI